MIHQTSPFDAINKPVFLCSSLLIATLLFFASFYPNYAADAFGELQTGTLNYFSWFYLGCVACFICVAIFLACSRFGDIKLGANNAIPEYSYLSWLAMLFSAGMGIGIMFFGVAEPVMHYMNPPISAPQSIEAAQTAMEITFFHWGIHAWAIYAITGLIFGYFSFRKKLPLRMRSALYPFIGDKIYGRIGDVVDIIAICSTLFGVATSLGYGVLQINAGTHYLFGFEQTLFNQVILVGIITLLATASVLLGLDKGIKTLSEINLSIAMLFMVALFCLGPTLFILKSLLQNCGQYFSHLIYNTFNLYTYKASDWIGGWTVFYWAWWLAWAPFVGLFIARISKGRNIREFIFTVMFLPSLLTFTWMTVLGNSALHAIIFSGKTAFAEQVLADKTIALFQFLDFFPLSSMLSLVAMVIIIIFFVTSSDSGSFVIDSLASRHDDHHPAWQRVYWSSAEGICAMILLATGGLQALQTATLVTALPFACVLLLACFGLLYSLYQEKYKQQETVTPVSRNRFVKRNWQERLHSLFQHPNQNQAEYFLHNRVIESFQQVCDSLQENNIITKIEKKTEQATLYIFNENTTPPFSYHVAINSKLEQEQGYEVPVILHEGTQHYDLYGYSTEQIIHDILDHYEKYYRYHQNA